MSVAGRVIFQIAAVFLGFGAAGLAGGLVFGMITGGIVGLRFLDLRFARFGMHHLKSLFSFSFWIFLAAGGSLVFSYADVVLNRLFHGKRGCRGVSCGIPVYDGSYIHHSCDAHGHVSEYE